MRKVIVEIIPARIMIHDFFCTKLTPAINAVASDELVGLETTYHVSFQFNPMKNIGPLSLFHLFTLVCTRYMIKDNNYVIDKIE